jgi:hypothetical protein
MSTPDLSQLMEVVLGGLDLSGGDAFLALNPHVLLGPLPRRRTNVTIPGKGVLGRKSDPSERSVDLEVLVTGWGDPTDPAAELETQVDVLRAATIDAAEDTNGAIECSVTRRDGVTLSGDVQVNEFLPGRGVTDRVVVVGITLTDPLIATASS